VIIVDDDPAIREVVAELITGDSSMELVGIGEDAEQALELARTHLPDVALLDVKMPGGGPRAARDIRASSPRTEIVALSAHDDQQTVNEMPAGGAGGYLVKGIASAQEILEAIRGSVRGVTSLWEAVASQVVIELATRLAREHEQAQRRLEWEHRIGRVLSREDELAIVFQPIVDLRSGQVAGMEALSRFSSEPVRGPEVWFAKAGLIGKARELEIRSIETAVLQLDRLPSRAFMSVNVSPETVSSDDLKRLLDTLPGERMVLEVTEHAPIKDYPQLRTALTNLGRQGVRLAIDDAGAGYASLRHILQLMPDFIKLDIGLTRGVDAEMAQRALASALVTFANEIGAEIIAEGVETPKELAVLRDLGVRLGQGFHLGRPGRCPSRTRRRT
jgi:EAL domain-containing protein (putative c-di-GMP-specific phosphodiesterase class I)